MPWWWCLWYLYSECGFQTNFIIFSHIQTFFPRPFRISCITAYADLQVRLKDGEGNRTGRVEVYHPLYGWGTVCINRWDKTDSDVVCRQLGFNGTNGAGYFHGGGKGPILLDNVQCKGNETFLWNCTHPGWGVHYCIHAWDVGVKCYQ